MLKMKFFIHYLTQADLFIYHMSDYRTPLYDNMEGLNNIVKAGKARYIGISNCFAWQLAKANALAERLLSKVTALVVGATKLHHIEGAAKAAEFVLSEEENAYLEEPYVTHALVGVMAQNTWRRYDSALASMTV